MRLKLHGQKLKNNESRPEFIGSNKKKPVYSVRLALILLGFNLVVLHEYLHEHTIACWHQSGKIGKRKPNSNEFLYKNPVKLKYTCLYLVGAESGESWRPQLTRDGYDEFKGRMDRQVKDFYNNFKINYQKLRQKHLRQLTQIDRVKFKPGRL